MPFLLIRGKFMPKLGIPDGDSVRFSPDNPDLLNKLSQMAGRKVKKSKLASGRWTAQLRYEGIDAMEKEAKPSFPFAARDRNLALLGFVEDQNEEPQSYILTKGVDPNGRPIVFVFAGSPGQPDGKEVFLDTPRLKQSINYKLAKEGLVYPMYYMTLYAELREELTKVIKTARSKKLGLWAQDNSNSGFPFKTRTQTSTLPPIFPKLYRRLKDTKKQTLSAFLADPVLHKERVATLSDGRFLHFDDVIAPIGNSRLKLSYLPEDLVFQEA